jgi:hypothetical protein
MRIALLICVVLLKVLPAYADKAPEVFSEVISVDAKKREVKITHDNNTPWNVDDIVCITREQKDIGCGTVIDSNGDLATVQMTSQSEEVLKQEMADSSGEYLQLSFDYPLPEKGDSVRLVEKNSTSEIRKLASELKSKKEFGGEPLPTNIYDHLKVEPPFQSMSNLTAGFTLLFPTLEYQQTVTSHSALGLMPTFMNYSVNDGVVKGTGLFLNYHFYSDGPLYGYWAKVGAGIYGLSYSYKSNEEKNVVPALSFTVGKRLFKTECLNFGFGAGGQYLFSKTQTGLSFAGFIPSLVVDMGFAF